MTKHGALAAVALTLVIGADACTSVERVVQPGEAPSAIEAQVVGFTIEMPQGTSFSHVSLASAGDLRVGSHGLVEGDASSVVTNAGGVGTTFASHADVEVDVSSQAQVELASHARVDGSVTASQPVVVPATATITGAVVDNAVLAPPLQFDATLKFGASTIDHDVGNGQTLALAPGAYDAVEVNANGTLSLGAGTYSLDSLKVKPNGKLVVNTTSGPVLLYVRSALDWRGTQQLVGPGGSFFVGYLGSSAVDLHGRLDAAVLAPNAGLGLENAGTGTEYHGLYWAKDLEVENEVRVVHDPFLYWGLVFTPTPTLKCVTRFTDTEWSALFGYENPLDIEVGVPLGETNHLDPPVPGKTPIQTFAPGTHASVFLVPFDGTSVTWVLGNQSATATSSAPRCTLPDYPPTADIPFREVAEGAGPAGPSLSGRFLPDTLGPGRTVEPAPLPWGSGNSGGVLSLLSATAPFKLEVIGGNMFGSDDGCGRPELYVKVHIEGVDQGTWHFPECPAVPAACGSQFESMEFFVDVPTDQPTVSVVVELWEEDGGFCVTDDHYLTANLVVDNFTGLVSGTVDNFDGEDEDAEFTGTVGFGPADCHTTSCSVEKMGSHFDFIVDPAGKPRICTNWNANFVDAGFGEDFATSPLVQQIPASFARARLSISRAGEPTVTIDAPLDEDGCVQRELSPDLDDLVDPTTTGLTLAMQVTSQFCLDPDGLHCLDLAQQPSGSRFIVGPNPTGDPAPANDLVFSVNPITLCNVITQDEGFVEPACQVTKASAGAFGAWFGLLPPGNIVLNHADEDDVTRVSAIVSHMLRREHVTDGELGIRLALDPGEIQIATNIACDYGDDGESTCAADPVRIQSEPGCTGSEPVEQCRNSDTRWKTIVAHEIGHVLQRRASGRWRGIYEFGADAENDHPGAPPLCRCDHVTGINTLHCLQSLEQPGAAQVEGYAQYVAARTWNALEEADCTLPYYKQFLAPSCLVDPADCTQLGSALFVNSPPVPRSCIDQDRWRNNQCLSGTFDPDEVPTDLSVESDWMGFYYRLTNPTTPDRLTVPLLASVYVTTCASVTGSACDYFAVEPGWRTIPDTNPPVKGITEGVEVLLAGGQLTLAQRDLFVSVGQLHGVDENTAP